MREILFRGKRTDNNEWVYGSLVTMANETKYGKNAKVFSNMHIVEKKNLEIRSFARGCEVWNNNVMIQVDKNTAGQYTGIKDKHGAKIFEGDIIRTVSIIASDKVGDNAFNVVVKWNGSGWIANGSLSCMHSSIYEVIGNIHDNKDLIK